MMDMDCRFCKTFPKRSDSVLAVSPTTCPRKIAGGVHHDFGFMAIVAYQLVKSQPDTATLLLRAVAIRLSSLKYIVGSSSIITDDYPSC